MGSRPDGVRRVGLTGGIASGKSVASGRLRERGVAVVDHDQLAREVVAAGSEGLAAVVDSFGADVLTPEGDLDRAALGARVFADREARATLNEIVHPRVAEAARGHEAAAVFAGATVVVHDIPLLVETGQAGRFDELVVVDAPAELRVARLVAERGLTAEQAWARVAAQSDDEARRAVADQVLDGSGSVEELRAQVDALVDTWAVPVEELSR